MTEEIGNLKMWYSLYLYLIFQFNDVENQINDNSFFQSSSGEITALIAIYY